MPLTLAPGASGTVTVQITPSGAAGSVVTGHLYIDTANLVTVAGDELITCRASTRCTERSMNAGRALTHCGSNARPAEVGGPFFAQQAPAVIG